MVQAQIAPTFAAFSVGRSLAERIEVRVGRRQPTRRGGAARNHQVSFQPTKGVAGEMKNLQIRLMQIFRGEKLIAIDDAVPPGSGTVIKNLFVGSKNQFPAASPGLPSIAFGTNSLGNGLKMDTCQPGLDITLQVEYLKPCTFTATLFGRALMC